MTIEKTKVRTQDDLNEEAPIDEVEERVEATMKKLAGTTKRSVGEGLQDNELEREGDELRAEGEAELKNAKKRAS
jgi:uncharacterized protein YjbJ (UPF0337 family)